ncbi:hypothetical protein Fmac_016369 [Flemingia macrophylla]|uniref:J domain-containing protein n=1 Tax=Flemingia macrophylla TaxID=520843 RepID=A0ABD1MH78_9FABA
MDHYKVLGLHRTATKEEIKTAFKKLAFQFHPDKHSQSPRAVRENATIQFKQVSEAYEVLMDDRKRANHNFRRSSAAGAGNNYYSQYSYGYGRSGGSYEYKPRSGGGGGGGGFASKFELALRILTARSSLLNLGFAAAILGAIVVIDSSGESLWRVQNSGNTTVPFFPLLLPPCLGSHKKSPMCIPSHLNSVNLASAFLEISAAGLGTMLRPAKFLFPLTPYQKDHHNQCCHAQGSEEGQKKSFEEAMKSIEKAKAYREDNMKERP